MTAIVLTMLMLGQAAVATPKLTAQQRFDAATLAGLNGNCADAIRMFTELQSVPGVRKNPRVAASVAVRKGACLIRTGQGDEGAAMIRRALPDLTAGGEAYREDVRHGNIALSQQGLLALDYVGAADHARAALANSKGGERATPLLLLTRLTQFDDGPQPLAYADEALALVAANPGAAKQDLAAAETLRARVLLNQGRHAEAYDQLKASLKRLGGLTNRVTLNDIATRSDLAIAALLNNDKENARRYLAYTGAGRVAKDSPFRTATYMSPPACGGAAGLKPTDFAVVEFSLSDDGSAVAVAPIYSTGNREVAMEFARAVSGWSWKAENIKTLPPFFRNMLRVELRCSAAEQTPSVMDPLTTAAAAWFGKPDMPSSLSGESDAVADLNAIAAARGSGDKRATARLLAQQGSNGLLPAPERLSYLDEAIALSSDAPVPVRTWLKIQRAWAADGSRRRIAKGLRALLSDPQILSDPLSAATIRMLVTTSEYRSREPGDAATLLDAVIGERGLPETHPLRVAALLAKANILARRGDLPGAQALFAQTGLTEEQCALIGVKPARRSTGADHSDFPNGALMFGFEGWVRVEFDIAADGKTLHQRAITAYPPFVFNEAATGIAKGARFQSSYRPENGVACSANVDSYMFRIAR